MLSEPVTVHVFAAAEDGEMRQSLLRIKGFKVHDYADWTVEQVKAEIEKLAAPQAITQAHVHEDGNPVINCLHWWDNPDAFGVTLDLEKVELSVPVVMTWDGPI